MKVDDLEELASSCFPRAPKTFSFLILRYS